MVLSGFCIIEGTMGEQTVKLVTDFEVESREADVDVIVR